MDASVLSYDATTAASIRLMKAGVKSVLLLGPPGCGKTAMKVPIAQGLGVKHIFQIKLSHHDVPDVAGVPVPHEDDQRTHFYASADMLPPTDLSGGLLFVLDEVGDCNIAQQNLACQFVFEERIHNWIAPPDTYFLLTSNRVEDRSGANRIVTKLGNRVASITVAPQPDELFMYGAKNGWNPHVLAFIKMHGAERINPNDTKPNAPTFFNSFDPSDPAQASKPQFASSRSYEFASKYLNYIDTNVKGLEDGTVVGELAAILGTPVASKLTAFRKVGLTMPDPDAILAGKKVATAPTEVLWALTLTLVSKVKKDTIKHMAKYLEQGPDEYLALAARILFDTRSAEVSGPDFHQHIMMNPKLKEMFTGR